MFHRVFRNSLRSILAATGLVLALAGCSISPVLERLPEGLGGLPVDAPARPPTAYEFPAVHDMPVSRASQPMSDDEVVNAENALVAARNRQEKLEKTADSEADPADTRTKKKQPSAARNSGTDSASAGGNP